MVCNKAFVRVICVVLCLSFLGTTSAFAVLTACQRCFSNPGTGGKCRPGPGTGAPNANEIAKCHTCVSAACGAACLFDPLLGNLCNTRTITNP
jgi:hypothetical protein